MIMCLTPTGKNFGPDARLHIRALRSPSTGYGQDRELIIRFDLDSRENQRDVDLEAGWTLLLFLGPRPWKGN